MGYIQFLNQDNEWEEFPTEQELYMANNQL
jgi:hypothetical protein